MTFMSSMVNALVGQAWPPAYNRSVGVRRWLAAIGVAVSVAAPALHLWCGVSCAAAAARPVEHACHHGSAVPGPALTAPRDCSGGATALAMSRPAVKTAPFVAIVVARPSVDMLVGFRPAARTASARLLGPPPLHAIPIRI